MGATCNCWCAQLAGASRYRLDRISIADGVRALVAPPPHLVLHRVLLDAVQIVCVLHDARHLDNSLFDEGFT